MIFERHPWIPFLLAAVLAAWLPAGALTARAGDTEEKTQEDRRHEKADMMRERANFHAERHLGYGSVYTPERDRTVDYDYIGMQIERLGTIIRHLADHARAGQKREMIPGPPLDLSAPGEATAMPGEPVPPAIARIYGPKGPTEKSVRLILEYRLMVTGNPRLKVGDVKEEDERIRAEVVTIDGSLVDEYAIDKTSGIWMPIR